MAGIYGIIHDQFTYTVSAEYYTKFKFYQFGLATQGNEALFPTPRIQVAGVGFMATWWTGIPIGLILGLVGLVHNNGKSMLRISLKALMINLLIALGIGIIGLLVGLYILNTDALNWHFPENLVNKDSFVAVGSMHNFSYIGGAVGLIIAVLYSLNQKRKRSNSTT